jgi:ABC-type transporter Mla MlaB component
MPAPGEFESLLAFDVLGRFAAISLGNNTRADSSGLALLLRLAAIAALRR